jgi:phospholipid/cholesterol/gamma-HCH transport system substrate-binding protein
MVEVNLKINKDVGIRQDASYVIGSSGLLGDRFVIVRPAIYDKDTPDDKKAPFVKDGDLIEGVQEPGLSDIMDASKPLIDRANHIAAQLDDMITRLNTDVLSNTSSDDLKETITKLRHMVDNGDSMITNANDLLAEAKTGKGVLGRLINDKQVGDNLAAFIANLKAHGPIFYKDDTAGKSDTPDERGDQSEARRKTDK